MLALSGKRIVANVLIFMVILVFCITQWHSEYPNDQLTTWAEADPSIDEATNDPDFAIRTTNHFAVNEKAKPQAPITPLDDEQFEQEALDHAQNGPLSPDDISRPYSHPIAPLPISRPPPTPFPKSIWQTSSLSAQAQYINKTLTWTSLNPSYTYTHLEDAATQLFVETHFADRPSIVSFYTSLPTPVLKADFFRYLVMLSHGGVYSDIDTSCLLPIDGWLDAYAPSLDLSAIQVTTIPPERGSPADPLSKVNLVVGVEYSDTTYPMFVRGLGFIQWTLYSKAGHVVFERAVERTMSNLEFLARRQRVELDEVKLEKMDVLEATGPGMLTDVIMGYLSDVGNGKTSAGEEGMVASGGDERGGEGIGGGGTIRGGPTETDRTDMDMDHASMRHEGAEHGVGGPEMSAAEHGVDGVDHGDGVSGAEHTTTEFLPHERDESGIGETEHSAVTGYTAPSEELAAIGEQPEENNRHEVIDPNEITWATFKDMKAPRIIGDVLVLPINAFGSGQKHSHSGKPEYGTALVRHHFGRSWYAPKPPV